MRTGFETKLGQVVSLIGALVLIVSCSASPPVPQASIATSEDQSPMAVLPETTLSNGPTSGPEAFSAAAFGVAASPRVTTGPAVARGGGYHKIGSSYVVRGKRYHPTANPKKVQTGRASWYGKAFHGRKTANGEVFDMNHLTAAHKTMPLPSYARVTNLANGRSVVVRVNDRGPFSNNRIIDLSKRAAEILDYTNAGTAQVKVEYQGPAPLHGHDDAYLIGSARGVPGMRDPSQIAYSPPERNAQDQQPKVSLSSGAATSGGNTKPLSSMATAYAEWRIDSAFASLDAEGSRLWKAPTSLEAD